MHRNFYCNTKWVRVFFFSAKCSWPHGVYPVREILMLRRHSYAPFIIDFIYMHIMRMVNYHIILNYTNSVRGEWRFTSGLFSNFDNCISHCVSCSTEHVNAEITKVGWLMKFRGIKLMHNRFDNINWMSRDKP